MNGVGVESIERGTARFSRRQAIGRGALAVAGFTSAGLVDPRLGLALSDTGPRPIPGGLDQNQMPVAANPLVHVLIPGIGFEMSTITDFKGVVAGSEIRGAAHGSDGSRWDFDTDMRFMRGSYVDLNGRLRQGAFGFI